MINEANWGIPLLFWTIVIGIPAIVVLLLVSVARPRGGSNK